MTMTSQAVMDCARLPLSATGASISMNVSEPLTDDGLIPVAITATARAVATALPFLDAQLFMHVGRGTVDGSTFARHMVIYLMVTVFDVPKKRLCTFNIVDLRNIKLGCHVIERRLQDNPAFVDWLRPIAAGAVANFNRVAGDA